MKSSSYGTETPTLFKGKTNRRETEEKQQHYTHTISTLGVAFLCGCTPKIKALHGNLPSFDTAPSSNFPRHEQADPGIGGRHGWCGVLLWLWECCVRGLQDLKRARAPATTCSELNGIRKMTEPRAGTVNRGQRSRPLIFPPTLTLSPSQEIRSPTPTRALQPPVDGDPALPLSLSPVSSGCQEAVDVTGRGPGPPRPVCCYDGDPEVVNNTQREMFRSSCCWPKCCCTGSNTEK